MKKRKIIVILSLILCINSIPTTVFASQSTNPEKIKLVEENKVLTESNLLKNESKKELDLDTKDVKDIKEKDTKEKEDKHNNTDVSSQKSDKDEEKEDEPLKEELHTIGWKEKYGSWYYYEFKNQLVKNEWKNIFGKWYYFNNDGAMQKGMQNINGTTYYFNNNGEMLTGWQLVNEKWYCFSESGKIEYGWKKLKEKWYYLDRNIGVMLSNEEKIIDGKNYRFNADGTLAENTWYDSYKYSQFNGECVNIYGDYSHSNTNYNIFKYMTNTYNQVSVHDEAIRLHGGIESNNCVYFLSEVLRRNGFNISTYTANVAQLESQLKNKGFVACYDLNQLKPGDIVFTKNNSHVYTFMCWADGWNSYIADNQRKKFGDNVVHKRNVKDYDPRYDTDPSTHFYYYPY
ncbi:cell wall-binding protein [Clostridium aquiflavi]|uniref:Cell wall-binding protein n=1 Tax=Clostridium aquiflavi TaxID=3073603 RepID=A0ABU1EIL4_9CLOT|nr:cell wall-binding protein [Clostridium sp. 5N-1]MDR5588240.1 cell wall-binding protein [Clostridium sp. 5N-1]